MKQTISKFNTHFVIFGKTVSSLKKDIDAASYQLTKAVDYWLKEYKESLKTLVRLLKNMDVKQVLKRGFSITVDEKRVLIKSISKVKTGQKITTRLFNGKMDSKVLNIDKK